MKWIALSDVIISEPFASSQPRSGKMNRVRKHYSEYGYVDKPIIINRKNVLLDGYIRYLVLKENNVSYVKAEIINRLPKKEKH